MDLILNILIGYVVCAVIIIYTLVFGASEFHRNGLIGKLHTFLTEGLQKVLKKCFRLVCPGIVRRSCSSFYEYFLYKPNHILQTVYLSLVGGGALLFFKDTYPYLNDEYLSSDHRYGSILAIVYTLVTYIVATYSDPGYITTKNVSKHANTYAYDRILYIKKNCESCNLIKPSRSKHCRICDKCVARMDHHCPWINNCVGEGNLKYFLQFVASTSLLCFYGFYLCLGAIINIVDKRNLLNLGYNRNGNWEPLPTSVLIKYLFYESKTIFPLGVFCLVISLFLFYFFCYHINLVLQNKTTNETFKWDDVKEQIAINRFNEKYNLQPQSTEENETDNSNQGRNNKKKQRSKHGNKEAEPKVIDPETITIPLPKSAKQLKNPFNKGWWYNLKEAFLSPR